MSTKSILSRVAISFHGASLPWPETVVDDSRLAVAGTVFVAVPGITYDGHNFIDEAIAKGCRNIIHQYELKDYRSDVAYCQCPATVLIRGELFREYYGFPDGRLKVYGVTGTNGKTTTCYVLGDLYKYTGRLAGLLTTVEYFDGQNHSPSSATTPFAQKIFSHLDKSANNGCQAVAMELSSHALDQRRAAGLHLSGAIFTNLTGDHLDYHHTLENYFSSKCKLFTELSDEETIAVINYDDKYGAVLGKIVNDCGHRLVCFGFKQLNDCCDQYWHLEIIKSSIDGTIFSLTCGNEKYIFSTNLMGNYNIQNVTGALLAAHFAGGITFSELQLALKHEIHVPGRLQKCSLSNGAIGFVDFAHTDDAIKNILITLRPLVSGKIILVCGAGGDRDKTKRSRMGNVATKLADMVIFTSDNPRSEMPEAIIKDMLSGVEDKSNFMVEIDRKKAIKLGVSLSNSGDIVVVAGKGHEKTQEISGISYPFDDFAELSIL